MLITPKVSFQVVKIFFLLLGQQVCNLGWAAALPRCAALGCRQGRRRQLQGRVEGALEGPGRAWCGSGSSSGSGRRRGGTLFMCSATAAAITQLSLLKVPLRAVV